MNTLYSKFQHLKANFVMSCSQNALKSLEKKEVILSWKSLENHSQISVQPLCLLISTLVWFAVQAAMS